MQIGYWRISIERVHPSTTQLAHRYDDAANDWDQALTKLGYFQAYSRLFARLKAEGMLDRIPRHGRVVDAGIGTGALTCALANQLDQPLVVEGVDISEEMLQGAQENLHPMPVRGHLVDAERLPLESKTCDIAITAHMLEHLETPAVSLQEMVRVLKPGAPLVVVMTKRSLLGRYIEARWNIHPTDEHTITTFMSLAGLRDVRYVPLEGSFWARHMSVACVGVKPL